MHTCDKIGLCNVTKQAGVDGATLIPALKDYNFDEEPGGQSLERYVKCDGMSDMTVFRTVCQVLVLPAVTHQ